MTRVLHVIPTFFPATYWGGPVFSTKAICDGVAPNSKFEIRVLTTDAAGAKASNRVNIDSNPCDFPAGYSVFYAKRVAGKSISIELLLRLFKEIQWADMVHLSGVYSFPSLPTLLLARILNKPVVWSPRGALQASAEWPRNKRRFLKIAFEKVAQNFAPKSTHFHTTSQIESKLSLQRMPRFRATVIPNSVSLPEQVPVRKRSHASKKNLLFIGRLHKKKGLDLLLLILSDLPEEFVLNIYGAGEKKYVASLKLKIIALGLKKRVTFNGHVDGDEKENAFAKADIFVLPSFSENFGIVIAEALGRSLPVVVSRATPWSRVEEYRCGHWLPLERSDWVNAIIKLSDKNITDMGERGRLWMLNEYSPLPIADKMMTLYDEIVAEYN